MEAIIRPESDCPINYTLSIIGGKWKWIIIWLIFSEKVIRYGKLKEGIPGIAHKTLSQQLKELENANLIHRQQYNIIPSKVEYSFTEKGKTLVPILQLMAKWGNNNKPD